MRPEKENLWEQVKDQLEEVREDLNEIVTRITGNPANQQDLVQCMLIFFWERGPHHPPANNFQAFCYKVMRRMYLAWIRIRANQEITLSSIALDPELFADETLAADEVTIRRLSDEEFKIHLRALVEFIPNIQQRTIARALLNEVDRHDIDRLARIIGCSSAHTRRLMGSLQIWIEERVSSSGTIKWPSARRPK